MKFCGSARTREKEVRKAFQKTYLVVLNCHACAYQQSGP